MVMSWGDALIGGGGVVVGGALAYFASARDTRQRADDAREDRNYASRREACLLLERQRARQLETADALVASYRHGATFEERSDHSDLQNPDVDAMVSIFLPDRIERLMEGLNEAWYALVSECGAIDQVERGVARVDAVRRMHSTYDRLRDLSLGLRQALREEARSH